MQQKVKSKNRIVAVYNALKLFGIILVCIVVGFIVWIKYLKKYFDKD